MAHLETDILLVGGGIMSATLGTLFHALDPSLTITMVEQLADVALESSDALNNAGTGHAGYCELNYTPQADDGRIGIQRALNINAAFEVSLQYWAHLVETGALPSPNRFMTKTPHLSFVWGEKNIAFLRQRVAQLKQHHLFADMQYSETPEQLQAWMPLMMANRHHGESLAASYIGHGADIDFGALTRYMVRYMQSSPSFTLLKQTKVSNLTKVKNRAKDNTWHVHLQDLQTKHKQTVKAKFVFLGAGGGALPLLQKANIDESKGYGGFPVSGQWLICHNEAVIAQHYAKVYGKAAVGAPPMSVPHLDTRVINGKRALLFGPFAGFTTKFLKGGSKLDLAKSLKMNNLKAMISVGRHNMDLTKYLIKETKQTHAQRMNALRDFLPDANANDWTLENAGQRVQIIKNSEEKWGKLEFGTEIVAAKDGTLAALLGASPGASVSVQAMLDVLQRCFKDRVAEADWQHKLKAAIPSYGESLVDNAELLKQIRQHTHQTLGLM
ncbi:malate:quinone-oxidoreductase [Methylophilaceae bacterium 11]|nr:malate:quinone-oxidoreductase [Methylophilaceae bacterium 11]